MAEYGLDITGHLSRVVTREMLEEFDLILTMELGHKEGLSIEFPQAAQRIFMLSEMEGSTMPVADPYGGTLEDYQKSAAIIDKILANGMERILAFVDQMHS
jgi:protein-tyrosine-phosphatase